ncbi:MAG: hypothetical protein P8J84_02170 [Paracoccaceae bacterium]|nr:hypothetical protein [Paracoccaceae bacterium]
MARAIKRSGQASDTATEGVFRWEFKNLYQSNFDFASCTFFGEINLAVHRFILDLPQARICKF